MGWSRLTRWRTVSLVGRRAGRLLGGGVFEQSLGGWKDTLSTGAQQSGPRTFAGQRASLPTERGTAILEASEHVCGKLLSVDVPFSTCVFFSF